MADAVNAANDLMVRYFGSRGRPTPRAHCRSILSELRVSRVDHQWHNPSMINRADAAGKATNEVSWRVTPERTSCLVNGKEV